MHLNYRLPLLALLLACGPLAAAQAPAAEDEAGEAGAQQEQPAEPGGAETAAAEDGAEAAGGEEGEAAPAEGEGALVLEDENFVPSVQISEDLSVSFPVDI